MTFYKFINVVYLCDIYIVQFSGELMHGYFMFEILYDAETI